MVSMIMYCNSLHISLASMPIFFQRLEYTFKCAVIIFLEVTLYRCFSQIGVLLGVKFLLPIISNFKEQTLLAV